MAKLQDISGNRYGKWTVIEFSGVSKSGYMWLCRCDCGNEKTVESSSLKSGASTNCGCQRKFIDHSYARTHGCKNERLYGVWNSIKDRCNNPNSRYYSRYGGRNIKLCDEWNNDYLSFREWAYSNGYDQDAQKYKCTIDRIDNNKGYSPDNCRFVPQAIQCNNRASNHFLEYNGERHTITEWSKITGIRKDTIRRRIFVYGWTVERALSESTHTHNTTQHTKH